MFAVLPDDHLGDRDDQVVSERRAHVEQPQKTDSAKERKRKVSTWIFDFFGDRNDPFPAVESPHNGEQNGGDSRSQAQLLRSDRLGEQREVDRWFAGECKEPWEQSDREDKGAFDQRGGGL